jgi:predicted DNA-binding ribbon-helix-helix protein
MSSTNFAGSSARHKSGEPMEDQGRKAKRSLPSEVRKRSIVIAGHRTSVSLEEPFWTALKEMASARRVALFELVAEIDRDRQYGNLSSAVRVFVLEHYRNLAEGRTKQP